ncbi:hypothetical protein EVAR_76031_1 [Eumeta japonica]|uniref:Uncharacterized protein n=1 Tax=Eumeta variegata TaxID=151549 RepID=A0A4C1UBJ7_EUMVA|nr:hypothetical protein EVAR_76031_1 [Eumeta japonica]
MRTRRKRRGVEQELKSRVLLDRSLNQNRNRLDMTGDGERATDEFAKRPTERYQFHYNAKKVAFYLRGRPPGGAVVAAAAGRRRSDFPAFAPRNILLFYVAAGRRETFSCRPLFLMCTIIRAVLLLMPRARLFRFRRSFVDGVTMPYKYRAGDGDTIFVMSLLNFPFRVRVRGSIRGEIKSR